ncbi:unnamed protein product [Sphenostylis stenocarpa]|uniref:DNA mismatch repair protein MutS-like N-terminal domain-containing protein n=1 Tax=Sphenostylis stenocarpa TaxID=92480 RepID=A0AA86TH96_9FABA|nr:unnamed protein product [Sphenostylis stenocarpa]
MYRVATRNVAVFLPRCRSLSHFFPSPFSFFISSVPSRFLRLVSGFIVSAMNVSSYVDNKVSRRSSRTTKKPKVPNNVLDDKDLPHILWWKERLQMCKKFSTVQLIERLEFSNLLGLDSKLKNGRYLNSHIVLLEEWCYYEKADGRIHLHLCSLKEGTLNWEMLQFKLKFPRQVGEFYEAWGIDACVLVEYAGLNPCGGLQSDSVPRAGCPVVNLRQTLDDLTQNGFSVCIVEEVQGPTQARSRKLRFISGHAHPGNPYVYGLAAVDHDLNFPEPMPVVGISHSARGYCMNMVLETMKTYSSEDCLTEEAIVTKLRTCQWGEFGEGGLLWGECSSRHFEWFDGNHLYDLLVKVKELYGLDDEVTFRNTTVSSGNRARPLTLGTSTQIGAIPMEGIPSLLKVLLPPSCNGLPVL